MFSNSPTRRRFLLRFGFFIGSVVRVVRPRPCRTFLPSPQFHFLFVGPNDGGSPSSNSCSTGACSSTRQKTDWFSHGPLTRFASRCGWACGDTTTPCNATQSWHFCPSISLCLALAESRMGVFPCSTGISDFVTRNNGQVLSQIIL